MSGTMEGAKVPKLRFPGFAGDWRPTTLEAESECLDRQRVPLEEGDRSRRQGPYPYYGASGIIDYLDDYLFDETLVLLAEDGANIINRSSPIAFLASGKFWVNNHAHVYRAKNSASFLATCLENLRYEKYNTGTAQPKLNGEICKKLKLTVPEASEQQKIADFLGAVDARVRLLGRRRDALVAYKKGLMQRLFSRTLRFTKADGSPYPDWEEKRLGEVLHEHGERSTGMQRVHSVSVHKGVIDQVEHLGRSFAAANTDHYSLAKPGDIIYTKSPTGDFPFGIVKQHRLAIDVIVSPLYGVFTPETYALGYILNDHFLSVVNTHNYLHKLVQKGAKNTINITNSGFLEGRLTLPVDPEEQQKIADTLSALDDKIDAVTTQIATTQRFKKGLLQAMFV